MANQWVRLWHEMPNDPKFKTVARVSKQPITAVISVYVHMLITASSAVKRGEIEAWEDEDIASSLDLETEQVTSIREAMQGRLLDGEKLTGWDKRQPLREDSSAERTKTYRDNKKKASVGECVTQCDASVTHRHAQDKDTDTDKDTELKTTTLVELSPDRVVFDWWREITNHPNAAYDDKRKKLIKSALKMGYSVEQLRNAITGCSLTPHNMGQNDRGEKYDGLHIILRGADQIDRFIRNSKSPPKLQNKNTQRLNSNIGNINTWLNKGETYEST